jgi:predicted ATPase
VALCRALDNLPLAVELAAARAGALTAEQMLERIGQRLDLLKGGRDAQPRHRALRATIDWSYDLLEPEEQLLYRAARRHARVGARAARCGAGGSEPERAAELLREAEELRQQLGLTLAGLELEQHEQAVATLETS